MFRYGIICLGSVLLLFADSFAVSNYITSKVQLQLLLKGNTLQGQHLAKKFHFSMQLQANGSLAEIRPKDTRYGVWYINREGQFCWSYEHKDKTWCRYLVKYTDNVYFFVKKHGKKVRRFRIVSGIHDK